MDPLSTTMSSITISESAGSQNVGSKVMNDNGKEKDISATKSAAPAPKSFARRDHLRDIELKVQQKWLDDKVYEANPEPGRPKYFLNFPYPYMNGRLHLGHAFSFTKAEFTARFQRLQGKNVLLPFAFHCTGMPIQAAANKLRDEIALFGNPPVFPVEMEDAEPVVVEEKSAEAAVAAKSKGKKSKLVAKGAAGKAMRQWEILAKMVPLEEIPSFADPLKWLTYFPPYGASDLQAFGCAIDWRRFVRHLIVSFVFVATEFNFSCYFRVLFFVCVGTQLAWIFIECID